MQVGDSIARFGVVSRATSLFFLSVPFVSVLPPPVGSRFLYFFPARASFCFPRALFSLVSFFLLLVPFPLLFPRPVSFSFRVASPSPFVPFRPVSVPLGPRRVRICKCPCLRVSNELVRRVCRDVVCFSFPFPRSFFCFRSPSRVRLGIPRGSPGAVRGAPRAPLWRLSSPFHRLSSPRRRLSSLFHRCVRPPPAFRARPPPFDYRLPIRIAPLLFWILFVRLFRSNSSPALLDSVRAFSPRRMAPLRGTLDVLRRWMRPISKLLPDSGRSLDLRKSSKSKNLHLDYFDDADFEN